jgi:nicotinamidase-related amidase
MMTARLPLGLQNERVDPTGKTGAIAKIVAGFAVTVLEDCCASPNPVWHRFSVETMLPLFGTIATNG